MQMKIFGIISVDFGVTGQLLILYSAFFKYLGGGGCEVIQRNSASAFYILQLGGRSCIIL